MHIDHILVSPAAIPMVKAVTLGTRRRKGGHREICVTLQEAMADESGPTFKAPRRTGMEEENVKGKEERRIATEEIIAKRHAVMVEQLGRGCTEEA